MRKLQDAKDDGKEERRETSSPSLLFFLPMIPSVLSSRLKTDSKDDWGRVSGSVLSEVKMIIRSHRSIYASGSQYCQNIVKNCVAQSDEHIIKLEFRLCANFCK